MTRYPQIIREWVRLTFRAFSMFSLPDISCVTNCPQTSLPLPGNNESSPVHVVDNTKPFRVTLAWTDTPGPTTGNAFVNNLDLEVTIGGQTYKGNVFTGALSTAGGAADPRNNMENVFLPAGVSGNFSIKVKATNIAGNGVPGDADPLDQDFALVAYNANEAPLPIIGARRDDHHC